MILYGSAELLAGVQPNKPDISLPAGTHGVIITNLSTWTLYVRIAPSGVELTIPPVCVGQLNVENVSPGNASMSVSSDSSIAAQFAGSPSIRYTTSVAPIPTNIIPLAPIPAYVQNSNITNASIQATVTGAVNATITNATLDVSGSSVAINNATSSPVPVSQQGTVDVAVTGTADVSGSTVIVNNPTSSPIPVSQTSTVNANITNATLAISSVGSITDNINSAIVNEILPSNSLVLLANATVNPQNIAAGGTYSWGSDSGVRNIQPGQLGLYDGFVFFFKASYNWAYYMQPEMSAYVTSAALNNYVYNDIIINIINSVPFTANLIGGYYVGIYGPALFDQPAVFNVLAPLILINNSGSTIASDDIEFWVYGIKATVSNAPQNPVQSQVGQGAFDSLYNIDVINQAETTVPGTSTFTYTLIDSSQGGYVKTINVTQLSGSGLSSPSTTELQIIVNGSVIYDSGAGSGNPPSVLNTEYNFGNGVAVGSGVVLKIIYDNSTSNNITVYNTAVASAIATQNAAPSKAVILV